MSIEIGTGITITTGLFFGANDAPAQLITESGLDLLTTEVGDDLTTE
jgi:hypothetical protein